MENNIILNDYNYNGLKKILAEGKLITPTSTVGKESLVNLVGMDEFMDTLARLYKFNKDEKYVFVYHHLGHKPKDDFVGDHFLVGAIRDFSPYQITFEGPEGKTALGVPFQGSALDIRPEYIHDIFLLNRYEPQAGLEQKFYTFEKWRCEGMPMHPYIKARDSVEAFLKLCQREPSLRSEMKTGYTLPVKLIGILSEDIVDGTLDLPSP